MVIHYSKCQKFCTPKFDKMEYGNSADQDQTASEEAV